jgi:hypothetical protein
MDDPDEVRQRLMEFGRNEPLRSAAAAEIDATTSFYRRPVRIEDFGHIDFSTALTRDTATSLAALTAHRLLLCVNDLEACSPEVTLSPSQARERAAYCSEESRVRGALIRPFLERFAFSHATRPAEGSQTRKDCEDELHEWASLRSRFWSTLVTRLSRHSYLRDGLRFVLIQKWCLHRAKCTALRVAAAIGYLEGLAPADRPRLSMNDDVGRELAGAAERADLKRPEHSYWQFYLSTSLAEANLLHALGRQPCTPLRLVAASFLAELDATVLCDTLRALGDGAREPARTTGIDELAARVRRALASIGARNGAAGVQEFASGWAMARVVAECAQADLDAQLSWISRQAEYLDIAQKIRERIRIDRPAIDRESFNEPREMCSTTHVHDDHRLVDIESGRMVFWANCGMQLRFDPGDVMFVPKHRLHGSTVESDVCRYHQPIIPAEWLTPFIGWRD